MEYKNKATGDVINEGDLISYTTDIEVLGEKKRQFVTVVFDSTCKEAVTKLLHDGIILPVQDTMEKYLRIFARDYNLDEDTFIEYMIQMKGIFGKRMIPVCTGILAYVMNIGKTAKSIREAYTGKEAYECFFIWNQSVIVGKYDFIVSTAHLTQNPPNALNGEFICKEDALNAIEIILREFQCLTEK